MVGRDQGEPTRWRDDSVEARVDRGASGHATEELDRTLGELSANRNRWRIASPRDRMELLERCVTTVAEASRDWVDVACDIKHIPRDSQCRAEEILTGPVIAMRYLRLMLRNLRAVESGRPHSLPGRPRQQSDGRWQIPVVPVTRDLFDPVCFLNFRGYVWTKPGLNAKEAVGGADSSDAQLPSTALVLGAGNVTGIAAADVLGKLFQDHQVALLKLHPLTDRLRPIFERAFSPLIEAGCLRVISGDAQLGAQAVEHDLVDAIHITGSVTAHDSIVWGADPAQRERRKRAGEPRLEKPITSELGNVSPWIIVPGHYSGIQLQAQAENVAASIVNNAGFNCVSTRVILTWKHWHQREDFLSRVQAILSHTPRRAAYYPGALERFERFIGSKFNCRAPTGVSATNRDGLPEFPWTLLREFSPSDSPLLCREESFVPICAELPLDGVDECDFLGRATDFANEELWGTLCAALTVPTAFRRNARKGAELHAALSRLRYGTVCLNHWPGIAFALLTLPWGGRPSATLSDPQSGLGWVHNSFNLRGVEKSILEGPLVVVPRPVWVPGHRDAESIGWKLFDLYHEPNLRHVAALTCSALASLFQ